MLQNTVGARNMIIDASELLLRESVYLLYILFIWESFTATVENFLSSI
jgi:hypothetical protein